MAKKKKSKKKFHAKKAVKKTSRKPQAVPATGVERLGSDTIASVDKKSDKVVQSSAKKQSGAKLAKQSAEYDYSGYDYVKKDVKSSFVISGAIIVGFILLWLLFEYSGLGSAVYRLIKI